MEECIFTMNLYRVTYNNSFGKWLNRPPIVFGTFDCLILFLHLVLAPPGK
jgi:hypothetical protein